eukprot:2481542-Rhodomonas_salina.5
MKWAKENLNINPQHIRPSLAKVARQLGLKKIQVVVDACPCQTGTSHGPVDDLPPTAWVRRNLGICNSEIDQSTPTADAWRSTARSWKEWITKSTAPLLHMFVLPWTPSTSFNVRSNRIRPLPPAVEPPSASPASLVSEHHDPTPYSSSTASPRVGQAWAGSDAKESTTGSVISGAETPASEAPTSDMDLPRTLAEHSTQTFDSQSLPPFQWQYLQSSPRHLASTTAGPPSSMLQWTRSRPRTVLSHRSIQSLNPLPAPRPPSLDVPAFEVDVPGSASVPVSRPNDVGWS